MSQIFKALRRVFSQPDFVLAVVLLGVGAVGLNFATDFLKLHYRKQRVDLRVAGWDAPDGIPATLGKWVQVSVDTPLDPDVEHILGTRQYVYRDYVDRQIVGDDVIRELTDKSHSAAERSAALAKLQAEHPEAVMNVGITYYTGMVDTVAHIPDRCYIADGYDVSTYDVEKDQPLGVYADGNPRNVSFRFLHFDDDTGRGRVSKNVAYLFHVNGHYEDSPLGVRRSLENLLERYGYYAKVELMSVSPAAEGGEAAKARVRQQTLAAMENFLSNLLPQVERCLPDWKKLHQQPPPVSVSQSGGIGQKSTGSGS
ncbi:MAG TPA: hypothetical protein VN541_00670 [Tepidisphaeraceae bacterium]|nr:hypothetical protein [Tepidisphaeraceae bacterium]